MKNQVAGFIAKHQLLSHDGLHLVTLSGGADSVALLRYERGVGELAAGADHEGVAGLVVLRAFQPGSAAGIGCLIGIPQPFHTAGAVPAEVVDIEGLLAQGLQGYVVQGEGSGDACLQRYSPDGFSRILVVHGEIGEIVVFQLEGRIPDSR